MDGSQLLFMLSCGIAMVNYTHAQEIRLLNFDEITPLTTVTLHEDTTVQTSLAIVRCVDTTPAVIPDCACNLLRTVPSYGPFDVWKLNNDTDFKAYFIGTAQATSTLDYDGQKTHFIIARCASPATPFTGTVTIEVDILPNQQPVISGYPSDTSQLFEGSNITNPVGTTIYTVTAIDPEGDALIYTMTQSPDNNWLTIGASDGVIRTTVDSRVITSENIICTLTISDSHDNTINNFIVTARFYNLNTRPYISNLPSSISVTEVLTSGFVLKTLTYGDYTPQPNQPAPEPDCSVNPVSECYYVIYDSGTRQLRLVTRGQLDFKTTSKYLITCVLSDGYLSSEGDVLTMYGYKCTDKSPAESSSSSDDAFFIALIALTSLTLLVVLWHVFCRGKKAAQQPPVTQVYPSHKGSKIPTMRGYI